MQHTNMANLELKYMCVYYTVQYNNMANLALKIYVFVLTLCTCSIPIRPNLNLKYKCVLTLRIIPLLPNLMVKKQAL